MEVKVKEEKKISFKKKKEREATWNLRNCPLK